MAQPTEHHTHNIHSSHGLKYSTFSIVLWFHVVYDISIVPCFLGFIIFPWLYGSILHTSTSVSWFQWIHRCMFPWFNIYLCFCGSMLPWFHVFRVPCYQDPIIVCFQSSMLPWFHFILVLLFDETTSTVLYCIPYCSQYHSSQFLICGSMFFCSLLPWLSFNVLCQHNFWYKHSSMVLRFFRSIGPFCLSFDPCYMFIVHGFIFEISFSINLITTM